MAHADQESAITVVLRFHQLLPAFHQRIQQSCQTYDTADRKRPMEVGKSATGRIQGVEEIVGRRSGIGNTHREWQIPHQGGCQ